MRTQLSGFGKRIVIDARDARRVAISSLIKKKKGVIRLDVGDPDFHTPRHIVRAAVASLKKNEVHYGDKYGHADFRKAVRVSTSRELGFLPAENQIVVGPSPALIYFFLLTVADPGDEVVVSDPGFARYYSIMKLLRIRPIAVQLREERGFRLDPRDVEAAMTPRTRLLIVNSPHNPTGAVLSREDIRGLADIAERRKIFILSDEVYRKLLYEGSHISPSERDHCREHTIILDSLSKAYAMTGWRIGYFIGPTVLMEKIAVMVENTVFSMPDFMQRAGEAALLGGDARLKEMCVEYRRRRDVLVRGLNRLPGIRCNIPQGALYVFPNVRATGFSSRGFADFMVKKAGVAVSPGVEFGIGGEGYVRLAFTAPLPDIKLALRRMMLALKKRK